VIVEATVEELSGASALPPDGIWVEVFGVNAPMHDYHAPGFKQIVLGLRRARVRRVPFALVYRTTRSNYRHAVEMVQVAHALGARAVGFAPPEPACRVPAAQPELAAPFLERAFQAARVLGMPIATRDRAEPSSALDWLPEL
jgi:hypothetical protein